MNASRDDIAQLLPQLLDAAKKNQLEMLYGGKASDGWQGGPYDWQYSWHSAGSWAHSRAIIAGNRVGKSRCVSAEIAIHATGMYPDWWDGKVFDHPVTIIATEPSNEMVRDIAQLALLGPIENGEPSGTGWIPSDAILDYSFRQCGVRNVMDYVRVRHVGGGSSSIQFKSYEQGETKFQGTSAHIAWMDEEPEGKNEGVTSEIRRGLMTTEGMLLFSRTPLFGRTPIVEKFLAGGDGIYAVEATWDDAPHLTADVRERMWHEFPEHERETRAYGNPLMGTGMVYPVPDDTITVPAFEIPAHWPRIGGLDFGMDHPTAAVWLALNPDSDILYLYDCHRVSGQTPVYHAAALRERGSWVPFAWPHDGYKRDSNSGVQIAQHYMQQGVNMLPFSARYSDDSKGSPGIEPIVQQLLERMKTGRFYVFEHLYEWMQEKRAYHRKDGKIQIKKNDDLMAATNYAGMMLRHARPAPNPRAQQPNPTTDNDFDPLERFIGT